MTDEPCGCHLTDWVHVPSIQATKTKPKAEDWDKRKFEDFHKDLAELEGTGTDYSGLSRPKTKLRDDFRDYFN